MVAAATVLGVMTLTRTVTPQILLVFTFLLGVGAVMNDPAWQSLTPDLVPPTKLAAAVALNSAGFNIARAVGPALGGLVILPSAGNNYRLRPDFPDQCIFIFWRHPFSLSLEAGKNGAAQRHYNFHGRNRYRAALCAPGFAYSHRAGPHTVVFNFCQRVLGIASADRQQVWRGRLWRNAGFLWTWALWSALEFWPGPAALFARCGDRLCDPDFCRMRSRPGAFAFARCGVGFFRRRRAGMDQHSGHAQRGCADRGARVGACARDLHVRAGLQGGLALGSAVWGAVASNSSVQFTLTFAAVALTAGLLLSPWYRLQQSTN